MAEEEMGIEELGKVLGIDNQVLDNLGTENLSKEKQEVLSQVVDMYFNDPERFEEFVEDSGLQKLLNNLENAEVTQIQSEDEVSSLQQEVENKAEEVDLDLGFLD